MKPLVSGRPRKVTDAQVRKLREWKSFAQLVREIGICETHAREIRSGRYQHKQVSP
jgi:hypothetical protein